MYQGAPAYFEDAFSEDISLSCADNILGVDLRACVPDSLSDFNIYVNAGYFLPEELYQLSIWINAPEYEPGFEKRIFLSVSSNSWSERSVSSVDYIFDTLSENISLIYDIEVLFKVRSPIVHENLETGYYNEEEAIYAAEFSVSNLDFHIIGQEGISEEEFTELIIKLIGSYAN